MYGWSHAKTPNLVRTIVNVRLWVGKYNDLLVLFLGDKVCPWIRSMNTNSKQHYNTERISAFKFSSGYLISFFVLPVDYVPAKI